MFTVTSNIDEVIASLERKRDAVGPAWDGVFRRDLWIEPARVAAERVCLALATAEEKPLVQGFVGLILVETFELGMEWSLEHSPQLMSVLGAVQQNITQQGLPLFQEMLANRRASIDAVILDWVETGLAGGGDGKRIDERDAGKSAQEIAQKLQSILFARERFEGQVEATRRLLPHIQAFAEARQTGTMLEPATVRSWLAAIGAAWVELVRVKLPGLYFASWRNLAAGAREGKAA